MTVSGPRLEASVSHSKQFGDTGLWAGFANSADRAGMLTNWLALLVNRIGRATHGAILSPDPKQGAFVPVCIVPDPRVNVAALGPVIEQSLASGRPASLQVEGEPVFTVAYPVRLGEGPVLAVVAISLSGADRAQVQTALRELHWAAGWLAANAWEERHHDQTGQLTRAAVALDLLAVASEHSRPEPAAMAIANELQKIMAADRVSLGMLVKRRTSPRIRLMAISYSAAFKKRSALTDSLESVMDECFDQNGPVAVPVLPRTSRAIGVAHADHVKAMRTDHIITAPLSEHGAAIGAISVERRRGDPFAEDDLLMLESVAALVGPMLEMKRRNHRWIGGRIWDGLLHGLGVLLGPRRLSWKLLAVALVALGIAAATVKAPFRIQADAVLRGQVQRAVVAPFNGFIGDAVKRAGDVVDKGALLARLDDTDLRLEELRWSAEIDRFAAQLREAIANGERAQAAFLNAQIAQSEAQLKLTRLELSRTEIRAPIAGTVVTGDLSQRLGSPLQIGDVLFEIAPLDGYRVDIYVDERDLPFVQSGQTGHVALAGRPSDGLPFVLDRVTPVAEARQSANTFRTEALLQGASRDLRPGMEGIAKIDIGRDFVAKIWTRRLRDWVRKTAWTWQP